VGQTLRLGADLVHSLSDSFSEDDSRVIVMQRHAVLAQREPLVCAEVSRRQVMLLASLPALYRVLLNPSQGVSGEYSERVKAA
jgi:hypothetical protein